MGNKPTKGTIGHSDCGHGIYKQKQHHSRQFNFSRQSLRSFASVSSQESSCSVSRRRWKESTITLPCDSTKTAWPVKQTEACFLPEFSVIHSYNANRLSVVDELSKGAFGKVYKVKDSETEQIYALKVLSKSKVISENCIHQVKQEVQIHKACGHHCFIADCPFQWQTKNRLYIVTEFLEGGELWNLIDSYGILPLLLVKLYVAQIALALDFLHNAGVIYRDLKPENILLDRESNIKLIDFGLSKWLSYGHTTGTVCGTPQYMAPEILTAQPYGHAVDWWSLGVLACVLLTKKFPTYDKQQGDSNGQVFLPECSDLDTTSRDLLLRLLEPCPSKRLRSVRALATIAFYKGYNIDDVKEKKMSPRKILEEHFGTNFQESKTLTTSFEGFDENFHIC